MSYHDLYQGIWTFQRRTPLPWPSLYQPKWKATRKQQLSLRLTLAILVLHGLRSHKCLPCSTTFSLQLRNLLLQKPAVCCGLGSRTIGKVYRSCNLQDILKACKDFLNVENSTTSMHTYLNGWLTKHSLHLPSYDYRQSC